MMIYKITSTNALSATDKTYCLISSYSFSSAKDADKALVLSRSLLKETRLAESLKIVLEIRNVSELITYSDFLNKIKG